MVTSFPFVEIAGKPYDRGVQYGALAAQWVRKSAEIYFGQLARTTLSERQCDQLIAGFIEQIEQFEPSYLEEMRGIAQGADVPLNHIVLINARTEVVAKAQLMGSASAVEPFDDDVADGCTGAILLPEVTKNGVLVQGQNWDWRPECVESAIILKVQRPEGPDILTFVEAGGLGRHGFNSAGIGVSGNYLQSDRDYKTSGVPLTLIRRKALDQEHVALSMKTIANTPKACSTNMMISHQSGWGIDYECAPDESFPLFPENGIIVHANHWASPLAQQRLKDTGLPGAPDSHYRDWRIRRLLEAKKGNLTREDLKSALFDDFLSPYSVCRPQRSGHRGGDTASVAMILMEPASGIMEVAPMPAYNRTFTTYKIR